MRDKIFVCQRCQSRIKRKKPDSKIGFEWNEDSFKAFKKEAKKVKDKYKLVLTSCLGPCPSERVSYQELIKGKMGPERSYPAKYNKDKVFKRLVEEKS